MQPGANPDLEQTLDRHGAFVRRLASSLVFDENRAEDLEQQAWLAAARHPPRDPAKARGWLAKVVRNFSFRMRREDVRRTAREQRVAKPEAAAPAHAAPPEAAMLREVIDAVVRLDEPYRSTVLMRFYENLEPAEIAERTGVPGATVRTRLKRALDQLRTQFDDAHGGDRRAWAAPLLPIALGALKPVAIAATAAAGGGLAAASTSAFSGITLGGILMAKKIGIACGLLAVALVSVVIATRSGGDKDEPGQSPPVIRVADNSAPVEAPPSGKPLESAPISATKFVPTGDDAASQAPEIPLVARGSPSATVVGRVVDQRGAPQPNVPVTLKTMQIVVGEGGEFTAQLDEITDERQLQTKTGQDGRFTFADLPLNIDASVRARPEKLCDVVKPAAIEKAGVMDLGDLVAVPGGSIAGTVLGPTGAPVKNCTVATWVHDGNSPAGLIRLRGMRDADTRSATTNASGQYRIDGVAEGECSVAVTSEEHPSDTRNGVRVRTNEVTWETDFKLATGTSVSGVVRDSEGHPMAGVAVVASPSEMFIDLAGSSGQSARKATTGADGRFLLQGLRAEPCNVRARKPGFVAANQRQVVPGTDVSLTLRPCGVAWGHVRNATTNEPVNEFTMRVVKDSPLDGRGRARILRGVEAAKAAQVPETPGLFAVVDLPDSPVQIRVQATDFADAQVGPFRGPPGEKTEVKVLLNPQAMIKGTVVDATGAPVEGARINFTNAKSEPTIVEGGMRYRATRRVVARRDTPEQAEEPVVSRAVTSGADGSFVIKGLPGGTYRLTASRRGFAGSPPSEVAVKPSGLADGVRLVLEMGGTFAGRALDPDGHPIAGARISLRPKEEDSERLPDNARSGAGGDFEFTGLRPGDYFASLGDDVGEVSIQVSITGGPKPDDVPVTVEAGKTVRKDLQQKARASLSGVVKEGGKPAPGIKVTLVAAGMPEFFGGTSTRTDENGAFLLDKVSSGDYSLIVDPPGAALPTRKSVALAPRAEQRITIDLPTGAIEGRITDKATGKPVAGITVTAMIEEGAGEQAQVTRAVMVTASIEDDDAGSVSSISLGGASQPIRTDSDGRYRLKYLSPAKYRVSIKGEGIMPQSRSNLVVETDKTTKEVDFGIEKGATLLVSIDSAGHDVTQVFGFVNQEGGSDNHDVASGTVKNGVKFAGLKPGRYHVRIDAPMNDLEGTGDIDVTAGQEARLTVRLQQRE